MSQVLHLVSNSTNEVFLKLLTEVANKWQRLPVKVRSGSCHIGPTSETKYARNSDIYGMHFVNACAFTTCFVSFYYWLLTRLSNS